MTGEFSAFTLRWTEVTDAQYYEIRASETPITAENWNQATVMTTVQAPADTAYVFVRVEVQEEPCIGCGLCEQVCPMDAIVVQGGIAIIDYDLCTACGQCMDVCPVDAITGTRYAKNYFFGIRAFFGEENPSADIAVSADAWRLIYYNNYYTFIPTNSCGLCTAGDESACYIITDYADGTDIFCGYGCPVDAVWQDTLPIGSIPDMIYIDYDECISCGQCMFECWNYHEIINPDPHAYTGMRSLKRRVVSADWVTDQPLRP
ncbi:MAG: 4Fe-4S binding protein [Candidatus Sabulitectum sp.]|nr:4Fe-4S binding protein [Candidatus Sabulitectum sp.]